METSSNTSILQGLRRAVLLSEMRISIINLSEIQMPHSYLFPQVHETWHFILKLNIRMLGDTCDELRHLSDFDLLATERSERGI